MRQIIDIRNESDLFQIRTAFDINYMNQFRMQFDVKLIPKLEQNRINFLNLVLTDII